MLLTMEFVSVVIGLVVLYLLKIGYAAQILCNLLGIVYPAYVSIIAAKSNTKLHDKKWLTYWVVYAVLFLVEYFSAPVTEIIPFYWLIKAVFLIWCMMPMENNGSVIIYNRFIEPHMMELPTKPVDQTLDDDHGEQEKSIDDDIVPELCSTIE